MAFTPAAPTRALTSPRARRALISALAALAAVLIVVTGGTSAPRAGAVVPLSPELRGLATGVDASKWQHPNGADVDWESVAGKGNAFAFLKATDGLAPGNDFYADDVRAARATGMVVGSYHKAHPAQDAAAQARVFAKTIQAVGGPQLPPVLDIELDEGRSPAQIVAWVDTFLTETKRLTGRTPILYTYRYFWITKTGNSTRFASYPLWIAEYNQPEPTFPLIGGWSEWTFWQRAQDGSIPGVSSDIDLDVFAGSREDLAAWVGPVTPGGGQSTPNPPKKADPVASDRVQQPTGSTAPTRITIPAIPGVPLPPGVRLPMTVEIPAGLLDGVSGSTAPLDGLPTELLKAATVS